jgi:hypothetical protein
MGQDGSKASNGHLERLPLQLRVAQPVLAEQTSISALLGSTILTRSNRPVPDNGAGASDLPGPGEHVQRLLDAPCGTGRSTGPRLNRQTRREVLQPPSTWLTVRLGSAPYLHAVSDTRARQAGYLAGTHLRLSSDTCVHYGLQ